MAMIACRHSSKQVAVEQQHQPIKREDSDTFATRACAIALDIWRVLIQVIESYTTLMYLYTTLNIKRVQEPRKILFLINPLRQSRSRPSGEGVWASAARDLAFGA